MATPEERYEMMRRQVNAKILWGTRDAEVLAWLDEKWGIAGGVANVLLQDAHREKRKAVRFKALLMRMLARLAV